MNALLRWLGFGEDAHQPSRVITPPAPGDRAIRLIAEVEFPDRECQIHNLIGMLGNSWTLVDRYTGEWLAEVRQGDHTLLRVRHEKYEAPRREDV